MLSFVYSLFVAVAAHHFISVLDIAFEHIFLFSLLHNDFDIHLQCYWNVLCCLLE